MLPEISNGSIMSRKSYSLHTITGPLMMASRCFGIFPVSGLLDPNPENLRFTLLSPYTLVCLASIVGQLCDVAFVLIHLHDNIKVPRRLYTAALHASSFTCSLLTIFKLARDWPKLIQQANLIEKNLPRFNRKNATKTCYIIIALFFLMTAVDHGMAIKYYWKLASSCKKADSVIESYYKYTMSAHSEHLSFSAWTFTLLLVMYLQMIFVTVFIDCLIVVVSLYLTSYFEELNDLIVLYRDKYPNIWHVIRARYAKLIRLVKMVDNTLGIFILLIFGTNFYVTCVNLLKILKTQVVYVFYTNCQEKVKIEIISSWERASYLTLSFLALAVRLFVVGLSAARLHSTAHACTSVLHEVPTSCYSVETRRLHELMKLQTVALSGQHFFYITRKSIFSMAASILTYEIILLQFFDL